MQNDGTQNDVHNDCGCYRDLQISKSVMVFALLCFLYFVVLILASYLVLARVPRLSFAKALKPNCNLQVISLHNMLYNIAVMLLDANMVAALHLAGDTCQL
jgi:hypothetical protein